ncbi:MAG: glucokinase [Francisellaceae bacterium]
MIVLSGDVGGTNTRLQLTEHHKKSARQKFVKTYLAAEYKSLSEIIKQFLQESGIDSSAINAACLAVAGPVKKGSVEFTNLPWGIAESELAQGLKLDIAKVKLINDFESIGYGIDTLTTSDLETLQQAESVADAPIAILGAGTGMGMGIAVKCDDKTRVLPTEGGHQDFAPVNDEQIALFKYLKRRLHRVSIERICCGPGLVNIYRYVVDNPLYNQSESPELRRLMHMGQDKAKLITKFAVEKGDPMSLRAVDIFIQVYGAVAGNLALSTLPKRGLYVVGGIAPKLISQIKDGRFIHAFIDKGRMTELMKEIPVHVVMNTDVGLQGAAQYAYGLCQP